MILPLELAKQAAVGVLSNAASLASISGAFRKHSTFLYLGFIVFVVHSYAVFSCFIQRRMHDIFAYINPLLCSRIASFSRLVIH